jgi:hypothetical protein
VATSNRPTHLTPAPLLNTPAPVLPPATHPAWAGLIKGKIDHEFSYAAAGMLLFNLNIQWKRDPTRLPLLIQQARTFFDRYQHLLSHDIQRVFT